TAATRQDSRRFSQIVLERLDRGCLPARLGLVRIPARGARTFVDRVPRSGSPIDLPRSGAGDRASAGEARARLVRSRKQSAAQRSTQKDQALATAPAVRCHGQPGIAPQALLIDEPAVG